MSVNSKCSMSLSYDVVYWSVVCDCMWHFLVILSRFFNLANMMICFIFELADQFSFQFLANHIALMHLLKDIYICPREYIFKALMGMLSCSHMNKFQFTASCTLIKMKLIRSSIWKRWTYFDIIQFGLLLL